MSVPARFVVARAWLPVALLLWLAFASTAHAQRPLTLRGTIVNPTGAEGTIAAWGGYLDAGLQSTVGLGTVAADGTFSLELPGAIADGALGYVDVTGLCLRGGQDMRVTPARFGHMVVNYLLAFETSEPVGAMLASSDEAIARLAAAERAPQAGDYLVYFLYVPDPVRIEGTCVGNDGTPVRYDVNARTGWNTVLVTYETADGALRAVLTSVDAVPADAAWRSLVD